MTAIDSDELWREVEPGQLTGIASNLLEHTPNHAFVVRRRRREREIEILGEPIGFEVAFLETGPTLEYPTCRYLGVAGKCDEEPPEDIVLLNDRWPEPPLASSVKDILANDH